jgi:quercetin dioxygenase-like cupin family protein
MNGVLPTGEAVEVHETTLLPGHMPHPAHKHRHSELMLIREGIVEVDNNGTPEKLGPGGIVFAASNVMHGLKNIGETNAVYFVVAIGRESVAMPV